MSERYEEVRRRLVLRGYLQGPVERFLLRDLLAAYGTAALLRTSAKAALLGAPILGGLLAASTVASNRPLLGWRDALVLGVYFAAAAAIVLFVLIALAAGLAAAAARRRGVRSLDALRAGLLVAVPVLAYLVIVWVRGRPAGGFGADVLFLAGATATTALVAWLAGLVSFAGIVGRTGDVPDRNRRSAVLALAVLLPVAALSFLLPLVRSADRNSPAPPSAHAPPPESRRLWVVGIDGLDGALVEASSGRGATDHLLELLARGATFPKHRAAAEPPEVWTTIATGMTADAHGVRQAGATQLPGVAAPIASHPGPAALDAAFRFLLPARTVPASGAGRRVRALWEIAGFTQKTAVVGWWASWPARGTEGDPTGGYAVSDRVLAKLLSGREEDRDTAPASLYARLARDFPNDKERWRGAFAERFSTLPDDVRAVAWESYLIDAFDWETSKRLREDPKVSAAFTYLSGLDILRTRLAGRSDAGAAIEKYLGWLDATVVAGLAGAGGEAIVLLADPGRSAGRDAEGFVAVVGGGAVASCVGPTVADLDVAPLVLRLLGLPRSTEMKGRVPEPCFSGAVPPPAAIATWGRRGRPASDRASDYDPEMVLRLKSLGYLR